MNHSPFTPPGLRADLPTYPVHLQALRVTGGTVPGPSGYMSSSVLGPSLYVAFVQQLNPTTLLPRDREPCYALDLNHYGLAPGYYTNCRLAGSYQSLPVYEVGGAPMSITSATMTSPPLPAGAGITPEQLISLSTLSPAQQAILDNLTPCQLLTLLTAIPISQIHTMTSGVLTPTQLTRLVANNTPDELTAIYNNLTTSQIITLTTALDQDEIGRLTSVLTPAQIRTVITNLTTAQLQKLATLPPATIKTIVTDLSTTQLKTFLDITTLPTGIFTPITSVTNTTYTIVPGDIGKLITVNNSSPVAISLPSATTLGPGWTTVIQNTGSGAITITPTTGTINGSATLSIPAGQGAAIYSNGTNWDINTPVAGASGLSGGSRTEGTLAATGSVQGDAAAIVTDAVEVSGADGTKGVILPNTAGALVVVTNTSGVSSLKVYPNSGAQIGSGGTNVAYTHLSGSTVLYARTSSTQWRTQTFL